MTTYTHIRKCFNCGSIWEGYGNICNACKTIGAINTQTEYTSQGRGSQAMPNLPTTIVGLVLILLIETKLDFLFCRTLWLLFKLGTYLMFGWWLGFSPADWGFN